MHAFFKKICFLTVTVSVLSACGYTVPSYHYARGKTSKSVKVKVQRNTGTAKKITVKKGDTVYSLSKRHNVPIRSLIQTNGLKAPFVLSVGRVLNIPGPATHVVQKGDTVYSISRAYGVDMSRLARQNNIRYPYAIVAGQVLILPGKVVASSAFKSVSSSKLKTSNKKTLPKKSYKRKTKSDSKSRIKLPTPPARSSGKFAWPVAGGTLMASFGSAGSGRHNDGINIKAREGAKVYSAENGVVAYAGNELKGFGNLLLLKHADGWVTAYAHNQKLLVRRGQTVKRGEVIATVGKTGSAREPQLHFEVRKGTKAVNPMNYLNKG